MHPEELALYIELQEKLKEFRGKGQCGDMFIFKDGVWKGEVSRLKEYEFFPINAIWLPLPIDPLDPDRIARGEKPRGLWGILTQYDEIGSCKLQQWAVGNHTVSINGRDFSAVTPTHVLLLALKAQWKEEK